MSAKPTRRDLLSGRFLRTAAVQRLGKHQPVVHLTRRAMACGFTVFAPVNAKADTQPLLAALDVIEEVETLLTVYRETSMVSQINDGALNRPFSISAELFTLLELCQQLHDETGGAFNIAAGALSDLWGFSQRRPSMPAVEEIDSAVTALHKSNLRLDRDQCQLTVEADLKNPFRPKLNFGSIGKGYALDRYLAAIRRMATANTPTSFLIHGGLSSVLAWGRDHAWRIDLNLPSRGQSQRIASFELQNAALATAGDAEQQFVVEGRCFGHILDPRTGWPANELCMATVFAPSAAEADALATAFYVMGVSPAIAYCQKHGNVGGVLVGAGTEKKIYRIGNLPQNAKWNLDLQFEDI